MVNKRVVTGVMVALERSRVGIAIDPPHNRIRAKALKLEEAASLTELDIHEVDLNRVGLVVEYLLGIQDKSVLPDLSDANRDALFQVLFDGAIMTYVRCFDAKGKGKHRLSAEDILGSSELGMEAHRLIFGMRNKYVGHDINQFRDGATGVAFPSGDVPVLVEPYLNMRPDANILRNLGRLARDAKAWVNGQQELLRDALLTKIDAMSDTQRVELTELVLNVPAPGDVTRARTRTR